MKSKKSSSKIPFVKLEADLKAKAQQSQSFKDWTANRWAQFETWVHSWFPGFKAYIVAGIGIIGSAAATLQQFVTGLPVTKYISAETMSITTAVLFVLSFWFAKMGDRVKANAEDLS